MVEGVEGIHSELQAQTFRDFHVLERGQVPNLVARAQDCASTRMPKWPTASLAALATGNQKALCCRRVVVALYSSRPSGNESATNPREKRNHRVREFFRQKLRYLAVGTDAVGMGFVARAY